MQVIHKQRLHIIKAEVDEATKEIAEFAASLPRKEQKLKDKQEKLSPLETTLKKKQAELDDARHGQFMEEKLIAEEALQAVKDELAKTEATLNQAEFKKKTQQFEEQLETATQKVKHEHTELNRWALLMITNRDSISNARKLMDYVNVKSKWGNVDDAEAEKDAIREIREFQQN